MKVLRPELYHQLQQRFGKVRVANQGQEAAWRTRPGEEGVVQRWFDKDSGDSWGEYYKVSCSRCGDTRFRLSIHHLWGLRDTLTGELNLWLMKCHRRDCFADPEQRRMFWTELNLMTGPAGDKAKEGKAPSVLKPGEVEWPGTVWPLDRLPEDNEAVAYLRGRRFDPVWLAEQFRVGVLIEPKPEQRFQRLRDRIVIPIFMDGKMVGWQARLPRDKRVGEVKYLSMRGMQRGNILYNVDVADKYPFVVVVEGPSDVWRFGPEAVAVLGQPGGFQANLLRAKWNTVVVLLDPDAAAQSRSLFAALHSLRVAEVRLPDGIDPGSFDTTDELRRYVHDKLTEQNFSLL